MASNFKFTESANAVLAAAQSLAQENANTSIVPVHIAASLLHEGSTDQANNFNPNALFANVLSKAGADVEVVARGIKRTLVRLPSQEPVPDDISFSPAAIKILREAQKLSKEGGDTFIGTLHLILPIIQDSSIAPFLKDAGSSEKAVKTALDAVKGDRKVDSAHAEESFETLSKYSTDLTALAEQGKLDPVIARDNEIRRVIRILSRRTKNNAVLIGEPGVGKTAIAEGLAQRIIQRDVPVGLLGAKLLSLDLGAVAAGASYKGQFEERVKGILNDAEKAENLILFIDEIHLITSGKGDGSSGTSAGELFKPALARGKIRVVGATTIAEYRTYIEKDQALVRRFGEVQVHEPDLPSAISILRGLKPAYELHHGTQISDGAIIAAATLAQRYMTTRRLPDSAIDLIDEAAASIRVQRDSSPEIIDRMQRQRTQIEIEIHALEQESKRTKKQDPATEERLEQAKTSLRKLDEEFAPILAEWQAMKQRAEQIQAAKERLESLRQKADRAERSYDIATASDIRHYSIPDLQAAIAKLEEQKKAADAAQRTLLGDDEVTADAIADVVARLTGIPANSLKESDRQRLLKLERRLGREVIGQPQAVSAVANAIRISRSGLANENKPTASFLFCGPSGTGKTQLVKSLATELFNDPTAITRIDGSEYSEKHSISRLIGSPPGYIGHDEGGQLTEAVRRKPFSIVLIDEIEKAHNSLSQLLLQIMDEGRLTDSKGNVVNFKNCIIILTSNLGSSYINALPPDSPITPEVEGKVHAAIKAHFLPEVLNRLDATIIFNPLTRKQVVEIVDIRLRELQQRMRVNGRKITLQVDAAAKSWLADIGFNPAYGARPLARAIQSELLNPLSKMILQGQILDGEVAEVTADNRANRLVIKSNHSPSVDLDDDMDVDDDVEDVTIEDLD